MISKQRDHHLKAHTMSQLLMSEPQALPAHHGRFLRGNEGPMTRLQQGVNWARDKVLHALHWGPLKHRAGHKHHESDSHKGPVDAKGLHTGHKHTKKADAPSHAAPPKHTVLLKPGSVDKAQNASSAITHAAAAPSPSGNATASGEQPSTATHRPVKVSAKRAGPAGATAKPATTPKRKLSEKPSGTKSSPSMAKTATSAKVPTTAAKRARAAASSATSRPSKHAEDEGKASAKLPSEGPQPKGSSAKSKSTGKRRSTQAPAPKGATTRRASRRLSRMLPPASAPALQAATSSGSAPQGVKSGPLGHRKGGSPRIIVKSGNSMAAWRPRFHAGTPASPPQPQTTLDVLSQAAASFLQAVKAPFVGPQKAPAAKAPLRRKLSEKEDPLLHLSGFGIILHGEKGQLLKATLTAVEQVPEPKSLPHTTTSPVLEELATPQSSLQEGSPGVLHDEAVQTVPQPNGLPDGVRFLSRQLFIDGKAVICDDDLVYCQTVRNIPAAGVQDTDEDVLQEAIMQADPEALQKHSEAVNMLEEGEVEDKEVSWEKEVMEDEKEELMQEMLEDQLWEQVEMEIEGEEQERKDRLAARNVDRGQQDREASASLAEEKRSLNEEEDKWEEEEMEEWEEEEMKEWEKEMEELELDGLLELDELSEEEKRVEGDEMRAGHEAGSRPLGETEDVLYDAYLQHFALQADANTSVASEAALALEGQALNLPLEGGDSALVQDNELPHRNAIPAALTTETKDQELEELLTEKLKEVVRTIPSPKSEIAAAQPQASLPFSSTRLQGLVMTLAALFKLRSEEAVNDGLSQPTPCNQRPSSFELDEVAEPGLFDDDWSLPSLDTTSETSQAMASPSLSLSSAEVGGADRQVRGEEHALTLSMADKVNGQESGQPAVDEFPSYLSQFGHLEDIQPQDLDMVMGDDDEVMGDEDEDEDFEPQWAKDEAAELARDMEIKLMEQRTLAALANQGAGNLQDGSAGDTNIVDVEQIEQYYKNLDDEDWSVEEAEAARRAGFQLEDDFREDSLQHRSSDTGAVPQPLTSELVLPSSQLAQPQVGLPEHDVDSVPQRPDGVLQQPISAKQQAGGAEDSGINENPVPVTFGEVLQQLWQVEDYAERTDDVDELPLDSMAWSGAVDEEIERERDLADIFTTEFYSDDVNWDEDGLDVEIVHEASDDAHLGDAIEPPPLGSLVPGETQPTVLGTADGLVPSVVPKEASSTERATTSPAFADPREEGVDVKAQSSAADAEARLAQRYRDVAVQSALEAAMTQEPLLSGQYY
eukprot:jgi/Botrbrau1/19701/Bobra.0003s0062.1